MLEWVGDGKTTQDIAILLGLTAATVEKHLRLAREALDVETTAQAVLKAAFYNQMFVIEQCARDIALRLRRRLRQVMSADAGFRDRICPDWSGIPDCRSAARFGNLLSVP